ncbi:MAG: DNA polymerase III subunit delta [Bdellovibrionia bacterium]
MPKLEWKAFYRELDQGLLWPIYWIYGPEKFKIRQALQRIKKQVFPSSGDSALAGRSGLLAEVQLQGSGVTGEGIFDELSHLSLMGGVRLVVVQEAHAVKNLEGISEVFSQDLKPRLVSELQSVCVLLAKDLDGRKKFSKVLLEKAAVLECSDLVEEEKESWIRTLAKEKKVELSADLVMRLSALEPWTLDLVDQELEKFSVSGANPEVILDGLGRSGGAEFFVDQFFQRNLAETLSQVQYFSKAPEEALPLLGLLNWNVKQLALLVSDRQNKTRYHRVSPFLEERFRKWSPNWSLAELMELQTELAELDFNLKQTPLLPTGLWSGLLLRFCR